VTKEHVLTFNLSVIVHNLGAPARGQRLSGTPLSEARLSRIGPLLERTPDAIRPIVNGDETWVHEIASDASLAKPQTATVYVQVDPKANRVVQASCRGYLCQW